MGELARPHEIKEWQPREVQTFTVEKYEVGELEIVLRDGRAPKVITVVRIHVPASEKPEYPHYWDLTASRITGQLIPLLKATTRFPIRIRIKADQYPAPRTHYEVGKLV